MMGLILMPDTLDANMQDAKIMKIKRGSICFVNLNPVIGHEQAGTRPCLVISADEFNNGGAGLVIVLPLTTTEREIPAHIEICSPEGGLNYNSFAMCEMVRSISKKRIIKTIGVVSEETMIRIEKNITRLLGLWGHQLGSRGQIFNIDKPVVEVFKNGE